MRPNPPSPAAAGRLAFAIARASFAACLVLALAGCVTVSGRSQSPFERELDDKESRALLQVTAAEIGELRDASDASARNRLLRKLLTDIDVAYLAFASEVIASRGRLDAGAGLLTTTANIASSLTGSAGVKANYAALTTLLTGGRAQVDAHFLYNQTSLALVAAMDEQRASTLADIRRGMSLSIGEYPGQTALGDAIKYYRAGTLPSAAMHLQKAAAARAEKEEKELEGIPVPTDDEVAASVDQGTKFFAFVDDPANHDKVRTELVALGVPGITATSTHDEVRKAAKKYYRENNRAGNAEPLLKALEANAGYKRN